VEAALATRMGRRVGPAEGRLPPTAPDINWDQYFTSFKGALATLKVDHACMPQFLGTMLIGLQSLLQDERYLSLQVDGGFSVANLLEALPCSQRKATAPPPPPRSAVSSSQPVPKPYAKQTKVNPPVPPPKANVPLAKAAVAPPSLDKRLPPLEAPAVSLAAAKCPSQRQGKHTVHSPSRCGIIITPPGKMTLQAKRFNLTFLNELNVLLNKDLKVLDLFITTPFDMGPSVFLDTTQVPTPSETAFILKHVQNYFKLPEGSKPLVTTTPQLTSYLKIVDIPITDPTSKVWLKPTVDLLEASLAASPVGSSIINILSSIPRIMQVSPHADTCIAWIDIKDSVSGTSAKKFIGKFISISDINCRVAGACIQSALQRCVLPSVWRSSSRGLSQLSCRC
jgi:hypothetical protein